MEISVEVLSVELRNSRRFELCCKAEAGNRSPSNVAVGGSSNSQRKFRFKFHSFSPKAVLSFSVLPQESESYFGAREHSVIALGNCVVPLTLRQAPSPSHTTKTGIVSSSIEGTDIAKFVGKIRFNVYTSSTSEVRMPTPNAFTPDASAELNSAPDQQLETTQASESTRDLAMRQAEDVSMDSLPTGMPTVSVIFHSLSSAASPISSHQDLKPIACLGESSIVKNEDIFQVQQQSHAISILKPVTLKCGTSSGDHLELHIVDEKKQCPIFSASHSLRSLEPFKHYNWQYGTQWTEESNGFPASNSYSNCGLPNVVSSVVYRPSEADSAHYEGLELLVRSIEVEQRFVQHNMVVCVQLISGDSKGSIKLGNGVDPPFHFAAAKQQRVCSTQNNCNIAVFQFTANDSETTIRTPVYFFFPKDPFFLRSKGGVTLAISVYATSPSSVLPWWQTNAIASSKMDVSMALKSTLEQERFECGAYWELSRDEIVQPEEMLVKSLNGVLRWKTTERKFISHSMEPTFSNTPKVADLEYSVEDKESRITDDALTPHGNVTSFLSLESDPPSNFTEITPDYAKALTEMGQDMVKLRVQIVHLQKENSDLRKRTTPPLPSNLEAASREDLIRIIAELNRHLKTETQAREAIQSSAEVLQAELAAKNELEAKYLLLEDAHTVQQKLVQQLQSKIEKYRKCYDICKQQETVITRLESLLSYKADGLNSSEIATVLDEKDKRIHSLQHDLAVMTEKSKATAPPHDQSGLLELQQKLMAAEVEAGTLASKLHSAASQQSEEKARYEHKLSEYRVQVSVLRQELESLKRREPELKTIVPLLEQPSTSHDAAPKPISF